MLFDPNCARCPRLTEFLGATKTRYPDYHCAPVAPFGDPEAHLLIVGLAPGMHGANASGRPFTGDYAGILLYQTLFDFGFSNQPQGVSRDDGLKLENCRITNAVKCLPPQNKPELDEIKTCNAFLQKELEGMPQKGVVIALGKIAHDAVLLAEGLKKKDYVFAHGARHDLPNGLTLLDSYHCSRYNTQTKRLTPTMFADVFLTASKKLKK
jgi:uracil-DNA glycosylase family 4